MNNNSIPILFQDERRNLIVPGDTGTTLAFCVEHWLSTAETAIKKQGRFAVALSGGSTPHAIYQNLTKPECMKRVDWSKVVLFWSDERAVPPAHPESNFHMAMQAGLAKLPIPSSNIFRMEAEKEIEKSAESYEKKIKTALKGASFDLMMLGVGEDGHTASLFPETDALTVEDRLVVANFIPQKKCWRMTLTFSCINQAEKIVLYVLGKNKQEIIFKIFHPDEKSEALPVQRVGTQAHPALWIADQDAAERLATQCNKKK
ncbi:MAG: 6-phosphogluconolactonase [Chlamydiales bacterium]